MSWILKFCGANQRRERENVPNNISWFENTLFLQDSIHDLFLLSLFLFYCSIVGMLVQFIRRFTVQMSQGLGQINILSYILNLTCLYETFQGPVYCVQCDISELEIKTNGIDRKNIPEKQKRRNQSIRRSLLRKIIMRS